jgi:hypothetical protein
LFTRFAIEISSGRRGGLAVGVAFAALFGCACAGLAGDDAVGSSAYIGQPPPGWTPELFAPGIVSTGLMEHSSPTFSPEGDEASWAAAGGRLRDMTIYSVSLVDGRWGSARVASFSGGCVDGCPSFSPDGSRLFFASNRLDPECVARGTANELDIWVVQREGSSWGLPARLGESINSAGREYCPTMTSDGTLYFDGEDGGLAGSYGLYSSPSVDSTFSARKRLPAELQSEHPDFSLCIAPDGSYLVFASFRPGGHGETDLYASFGLAGGGWSPPVNLGPTINTRANERFPSITRDGEFLFFVSDRRIDGALSNEPGNGLGDVYWAKSEVVRGLRPTNQEALTDP